MDVSPWAPPLQKTPLPCLPIGGPHWEHLHHRLTPREVEVGLPPPLTDGGDRDRVKGALPSLATCLPALGVPDGAHPRNTR